MSLGCSLIRRFSSRLVCIFRHVQSRQEGEGEKREIYGYMGCGDLFSIERMLRMLVMLCTAPTSAMLVRCLSSE